MKTKKIPQNISTFLIILIASISVPRLSAGASNALNDFNINEYLVAPGQQNSYFKTAETQNTSPIGAFLLDMISYMLLLMGTICIGIIIIGGILLISARGNETQLEKGKNAITYALIGLVIAFSSYTISVFVQSLLYTNTS